MPELTITQGSKTCRATFRTGMLLSDILEENGFLVPRPCGGRGVCGKCGVEISGEVSEPDAQERIHHVRLACRTYVYGDAAVTLLEKTGMNIEQGTAAQMGIPMEGRFGAAVDIGTTTVVMQVYDLSSGILLGSSSMLNPQTSVAADVMGRIGAAMAGKLEDLRCQITRAIKELLTGSCAQAGIREEEVDVLVVTGNTTMLYLLTGQDPAALSHAPFEADRLFGEEITLLGRRCYLPACMNAFVGADITTAVLASRMCEEDITALLCDVGTNGELALWYKGRLLVTSTAAGPAFEGAGITMGCGSIPGAIDRVTAEGDTLSVHTIGDQPAVGVCGSGLLDAIAAGLKLELIDETGALEEDTMPLAEGVSLYPKDIRAVQLAKSAICAGIETLLEEAGISLSDVRTVYIAGGFGSHLNVNSAEEIGLFPKGTALRSKVIGNAALTGAAELLLDREKLAACEGIVAASRHVMLGGNPAFNERYMEGMLFSVEE